jgi:Zn-dependent peptidase ImmA (M78 family)
MLWRQLRERGYGPNDLIKWARIERPPIPIGSLASQLGIEVVKVNTADWVCATRTNKRGAVIWYRQTDNTRLARFAVAQGIGHIFKDPPGDNFTAGEFAGGAFSFASRLLMPAAWFALYGNRYEFSRSTLVDVFDVEEGAINARMHQLVKAGYF